ncbi:putative reverse transcriptase domain-containing protein [Tanacetum coccineum]
MPPRKASKTRTTRSSPATTTTTTTPMTDEQLKTLIAQGVADLLAERDTTRSINGEDSHDSSTGVRRQASLARECTYRDFMKCKPLYFKGTEGVVELTQWFERMETVFRISNCTNKRQNTGRAYAVGSSEKKPYGVLQMPILLTTKGALRQVKNLHALNVEPRDISRGVSKAEKQQPCDDMIFVSTAFSSQIDITQTTLDHYYDVELADGRIVGLNTIIRSCTLNFLNHPFSIHLMHIELGSFDVIIGMDWFAKYQAAIVCTEKIVRIPRGNETLIVHGDGSNRGNE